VAVLSATLACCAGVEAPDTPPSSAVQDLRVSATDVLGTDELVAEAIDGETLSELLADAGFRTAVQRSYAGGVGAIRHVEVVVVRFESIEGADRYLDWLDTHVTDLIGNADPAAPTGAPPMSLHVHRPTGCCPEETPAALAAWRHGQDVVRVVISGPAADDAAAVRLLTSVHRWIADS
jgi:hypothetical protein